MGLGGVRRSFSYLHMLRHRRDDSLIAVLDKNALEDWQSERDARTRSVGDLRLLDVVLKLHVERYRVHGSVMGAPSHEMGLPPLIGRRNVANLSPY